MQTVEASKINAFKSTLPDEGGVLGATLKKKAFEALIDTDFPTTKVEQWKYTRVGKIANNSFSVDEGQAQLTKDSRNKVIQFVNGQLTSDLPEIEGVEILPIGEATTDLLGQNLKLEDEVFQALNTAYATAGVVIRVSKNTKVGATLHLEHWLTHSNTLGAVRHCIIVEEGAEINLIQSYNSENVEKALSLPVTEVFVKANAKCTIEKLQQESDANFHIATEQVAQEKDSRFTIRTITLNGGLVRNNLNIEVNGQNCETNLYGAYLTKGKQHVDNHTVVDHKVSNCESNELYKGVMDEKSTAVFNGKVFVRQDAQKINAFQSNGNVLLTDDASINSKPELEIYADDVKCSHGSTTGQLDDQALYYLRARGLSQKSAKQLLIRAFVAELFEGIENEYLSTQISSTLQERFGWQFD